MIFFYFRHDIAFGCQIYLIPTQLLITQLKVLKNLIFRCLVELKISKYTNLFFLMGLGKVYFPSLPNSILKDLQLTKNAKYGIEWVYFGRKVIYFCVYHIKND